MLWAMCHIRDGIDSCRDDWIFTGCDLHVDHIIGWGPDEHARRVRCREVDENVEKAVGRWLRKCSHCGEVEGLTLVQHLTVLSNGAFDSLEFVLHHGEHPGCFHLRSAFKNFSTLVG